MVENRLVDIVGRAFDAGIRFGQLVDKDMVAVTLGPPLKTYLLAAPAYLAEHPIPLQPLDLLDHQCILFRYDSTGLIERWSLNNGQQQLVLAVNGRFITNDSVAMMQAALDGMGIAWMVGGYVEKMIDQGRLVSLLPQWCPQVPGFTLYYPDRRQVSLKLRVFIDFLKQELAEGLSPDASGWFSPSD